ncbi:MAG: CDP-alcohol phosphatidyltransferase family protein [Actinomycetes bacterium]
MAAPKVLIDHSGIGPQVPHSELVAALEKAGASAVVLESLDNLTAISRIIDELETQSVCVIDGALLTGQTMVDAILAERSTGLAALVRKTPSPQINHAARVTSKRIVSSSTELHRVTSPTHELLGVIRLENSPSVIQALKDSSKYLESLDQQLNLVDLVTLILVRSGHEVFVLEPSGICERNPSDVESVLSELLAQDEARVKFGRALRTNDGFYSTFVLRKLSRFVTRVAIWRGWTPNQITVASLAISFVASIFFATGNRTLLAIGAILVQLAIIVDCSDGEVARYTGVSSALGAWLDAATDRIKEYVMYAALALGASRHHENLWTLVFVLIVLQTVRHLSDYNFVAVRGARDARIPTVALNHMVDDGKASAGSLMDTSESLNSRRAVYWIKRVIYFPIGERWLVITVGALLGSPKLIFTSLLIFGSGALIYVSVGRFMRSRSWNHPQAQSGCDIVERQIDAGPLMQWIFDDGAHPLSGRFGWSAPSLARLFELGLVAVVCHAHPIAFWWLFAVAFHHYDTLYRSLSGHEFPRKLTRLGLGVEGRTLVLLLSSIGFLIPLKISLVLAGGYFTVLFVGYASAQWIRELQTSS